MTIQLMALKNIKAGEYIGIHLNLGGLRPAVIGTDQVIGAARRDIYAGEIVSIEPGKNSEDVLNSSEPED